MKIYIIGGPGSGKTTTAQRLSKQYHIPHFDLDDINWKNSDGDFYGQKRDATERRKILADLLESHSEWIFEGAYFSDWINPIIEQADNIIILKPSKWIRFFRCFKRFLKRKFGLEKSPYKESFLSFYRLVLWNHKYDEEGLSVFLQKIKDKKVPYDVLNK